ncbi:hypothetical protein BN961_00339 [Afipia felis]|uniref:Uncharacterized protein n=1 Tax=Afipia felis TaxID=1035 RepID=A0A090N6J4_AFIFE|nr:hypothetical protein BN961_00339 [Afipia felis]
MMVVDPLMKVIVNLIDSDEFLGCWRALMENSKWQMSNVVVLETSQMILSALRKRARRVANIAMAVSSSRVAALGGNRAATREIFLMSRKGERSRPEGRAELIQLPHRRLEARDRYGPELFSRTRAERRRPYLLTAAKLSCAHHRALMPGANRPQGRRWARPFCRFLTATTTHWYALTSDLFSVQALDRPILTRRAQCQKPKL